MIDGHTIEIPPGAFLGAAIEGAAPYPHSMYHTHQAIDVLLKAAMERFHVREWNLAGLLGLEDQGHIYK